MLEGAREKSDSGRDDFWGVRMFMQCTQTEVRTDANVQWYLQLAFTCKQTVESSTGGETDMRTDSWHDEAVPGDIISTPELLYSTWDESE